MYEGVQTTSSKIYIFLGRLTLQWRSAFLDEGSVQCWKTSLNGDTLQWLGTFLNEYTLQWGCFSRYRYPAMVEGIPLWKYTAVVGNFLGRGTLQ